jgi:hypothetical protein
LLFINIFKNEGKSNNQRLFKIYFSVFIMKRGILISLLIMVLIIAIFVIIWLVLRNHNNNNQLPDVVVDGRCIETKVVPTSVTNLTPENFSVNLFRQEGIDEIGGVKLIFSDNNSRSSIASVPANMTAFENVSVLVLNVKVPDPSKVEVVVYFLDDSGNETLCPISSQLEF